MEFNWKSVVGHIVDIFSSNLRIECVGLPADTSKENFVSLDDIHIVRRASAQTLNSSVSISQ